MPLLTKNELPPGGWFYNQLDAAGVVFKRFHSQGPFSDFCRSVLGVRSANGLPGADIETVTRDVDKYQCDRLGNDPRFCGSGSGPVTQVNPTFLSVSVGGCGTCGGSKIQ